MTTTTETGLNPLEADTTAITGTEPDPFEFDLIPDRANTAVDPLSASLCGLCDS